MVIEAETLQIIGLVGGGAGGLGAAIFAGVRYVESRVEGMRRLVATVEAEAESKIAAAVERSDATVAAARAESAAAVELVRSECARHVDVRRLDDGLNRIHVRIDEVLALLIDRGKKA